MVWLAVAAAAASIYSGYAGSKAAKAGGKAAQEAALANAADIRDFGAFNASSILNVGSINAQAIIDVGEINAQYIERSTDRNLFLYGLQADEDVNRHVRAEKQVAGDIRARASGSGVQVNTGSPLQFLNAQVDEGIRQREYMVLTHTETITSMAEEGKDKAFVTRYTADKNAEVTLANAQANAEMALANAELSASQQENAGELAYQSGQIAASQSMIQGVTGAISAGSSLFAAGGGTFGTQQSNYTMSSWTGSTYGFQSQLAGN